MIKIEEMNVLALAYIGDSVYDTIIRFYLLDQGMIKPKELQRMSVHYVSARAQSAYLKKALDASILSTEELDIVKRARNHKGTRHPKNADIVTYKEATGLEALIGFYYLKGNKTRIKELMKEMIGEEICISLEKMWP